MKRLKKILVTVLMICLMCPCISVITEAAEAELRFSDPSTTVGAEVDVTVKLSSASSIRSMEAALEYDTSSLKFISGDNATENDGTIKLMWTGSGTTAEFGLKFQALQEGNTNIEVASAKGTSTDGTTLDITEGSSAITIGEGDPSLIQDNASDSTVGTDTTDNASAVTVKIGKKEYTVSNDFSDALIPEGFTRNEISFEGTNCQVITQESSGTNAMYLTENESGVADFYLYNNDDGSFSPFEEVEISKDHYIIPILNDGKLKLSNQYQKTTLTLNGKEFDTWQDTKNAEYYIIYALNSNGEKTTYRYDTSDGTYQKYEPETSETSTISGKNGKGLWGKVLNFVENFLDIVVIIALALILILVLVLIVTSVKLYHRDLELDDLYDEYGIDMDEEEAELKAKKKEAKAGKKAAKKVQKEEAKKAPKKVQKENADEDEFEGYNDDDFDDEDPWATENIAKAMKEEPAKKKMSETRRLAAQSLDESGPAIRKPVNNISIQDDDFEVFAPLDEEEFDNFEGYYGEDDDDDYDMFGESDYDDDDMFDETSDLLSNHPEKIRSHAEMDDTFKMDVIDLD
nr:cohesin domain-containing protein [uncultured Dorea sp.]